MHINIQYSEFKMWNVLVGVSVGLFLLCRKSFVYFKSGTGSTTFTFTNEEHPVIYVSNYYYTAFNNNNERGYYFQHFKVTGEGVAPVKGCGYNTVKVIVIQPLTSIKLYSPGISPPTDVTAVQDGRTSIILSWTPSIGATGYRIYYDSSGGHSGFVDVSGGITDTYNLLNLHNGDGYTVSIMATSNDPPSILVQLRLLLSKI